MTQLLEDVFSVHKGYTFIGMTRFTQKEYWAVKNCQATKKHQLCDNLGRFLLTYNTAGQVSGTDTLDERLPLGK